LVGLHLVEADGLIDAGGTVVCELLAQLGGNVVAMFAFSCDLGATPFRFQILTTVQPGVGPFSEGQHPMLFVADIHARFVRIHPVRDGNGRVGRLATNLLLVRHGYPPAVVYKRDRTRYLDPLRRADRGDPGRLAEMFARALTHGIHRFLLRGLAGPRRLVPLRSLADSELSGNALAVAAKRGRMRAVRRTDQWYSTRQWVEEYKEGRYRRL
jgi:hypothetical protein